MNRVLYLLPQFGLPTSKMLLCLCHKLYLGEFLISVNAQLNASFFLAQVPMHFFKKIPVLLHPSMEKI